MTTERSRFPGLIRCDVPGCPALVEPNILRCEEHRRELGDHPDRYGRPGRIAKPKRQQKGR